MARGYYHSGNPHFDWEAIGNDFRDFGGAALEFGLNHGPGRFLTDRDFDYGDYGSMLAWSEVPIIGSYAARRAEQLKYEEQQRYNRDRAANLGIDLEDNPYPITAGLYAGVGSGNTPTSVGNSIVNMYHELDKLKRWK